MSSRRMALFTLALAALSAVLPTPAAAGEPAMLRLVDAPSVAVPKELAASPVAAPVRLNLAALEESRLRLPLPDGKVLRIHRTDVERRGPRDYAWRGRMFDAKGEVEGNVTITVWKNLMRARIVTPGKIWILEPHGGRYWLSQHTGSDLPCGTTGRSEVVPLVLKQALADKAEAEGLQVAEAAAFTRLRLVVVYPRASTLGDPNRLNLAIRGAVDDANTALANSGINARVELVMTREVNHPESKDPVDDLIYLYEDPSMVALRRQANVKLISYISINSAGICGIGNLMDTNEYLGRSPALGVSLVRRNCLNDQTLMHELGHNLGAHHDPANTDPGDALFEYGYGHFVVPIFSTIMSYTTECGGASLCPRIDYFSNPRQTFAGHPIGIENQRDNARLIEATHSRYAVSTTTPGAACKPGADRLCLLKKRFQVEVVWNNQFNGASGTGRAVPRTDAAGFFSFGDPSNLELMVKLLDFGDTVKVFWGQLTNLRYSLVITDTKTGESKTYQNTAGDCGGIDQNAFRGGLALDAATLAPVAGPLGAPAKTAACRSTSQELCLDNRFLVNVDWRNPGNGTQGKGVAVPFSKLTGAFHFGQASNLELMAKVITSGDRVDFFWGALSDLEYTINVNDTLTGQIKTYQNPAGKYCGGLQVDAF